jgi:hypothetical protein
VLYLFGEKPAKPDVDRVAYLHNLNHVERAGLPPRVPGWLMPEVKRCRQTPQR